MKPRDSDIGQNDIDYRHFTIDMRSAAIQEQQHSPIENGGHSRRDRTLQADEEHDSASDVNVSSGE
jgi:hypothetical protein